MTDSIVVIIMLTNNVGTRLLSSFLMTAGLIIGLVFATAPTLHAATMPISAIPIGGIISINGQKFVKIDPDDQFVSLAKFVAPGFANGMPLEDFTAAMCNSGPTPTGTNYFFIGTLIDSRDGKSYEVRKFADGKCWMVNNLKYGGATDACAAKTAFSGKGSGTATNTFGPGTYGDCRSNSGNAAYGYLYNWQAAIQHPSAYYGNSFQPPEPIQGLCPAGWHIPTGGVTGELQTLHAAAGSPATGFWQGGNWQGVYAGASDDYGGLYFQGSDEQYWSSTQYDASSVYFLHFNSSSVSPANSGNKYLGHSIRCVKDTVDASTLVGVTMQTFTVNDCSALSTPSSTNYIAVGNLTDERDGKSYEIRKFADGKCWMVDNLKYGGGTDGSSDYCAAKTTFRSADSTANATAAPTNGLNPTDESRNTLYGDCRSNPGSTDYGYLYNWTAVIQDAYGWRGMTYQPTEPTQGICPSGWHLPKGGSSGEFQVLHTAAGSPASGFWQGGNWKGVYSGYCSASGSLGNQGSDGYYWSSTQHGAFYAYDLYFTSSSVNPAGNPDKIYGFSIRCIKDGCQPNYLFASGNCAPAGTVVPNCTVSDGFECTACGNGFKLDNGMCTAVPNCVTSDGQQCTACTANYLLSGGSCVAAGSVVPNCTASDGVECTACTNGMIVTNNTCVTPLAPNAKNGTNMQDFSSGDCARFATPAASGNVSGTAAGNVTVAGVTGYTLVGTLKDTRDGKSYEIRKFIDGKCWMVDNLKYGGGTDGSSDYCANKTTFRVADSAFRATATTANGLNPTDGSRTTLVGDCRNNPGSSSYGYLYNWPAAIQNGSGWSGNSFQPTEPTQGICPTGWHLPSGYLSGEYHVLDDALAEPVYDYEASLAFWNPGGSWKGVYSGQYRDYGGLLYQGSLGNHWSSGQNTTELTYSSQFSSEAWVSGFVTIYKSFGLAIRCIKD